MKKFILILLGIIVVATLGLSIYVSTIDWNKHKGKLTDQLLEITGKRIVFNGPVRLSVFPFPTLKASNVRVYSAVNKDLEHPLMKIESIDAQLSFSALLGGGFDVKMMSLVKPQIFVRREDKKINWLDNAKMNTEAELKGITIALDSVLLRDATMTVIDEDNNINATLNNLNAEVIADDLNGPYRIDGSYVKDKNPEGFAISIGNLSESFATNLNFVLSQPSSDTYVRFDGTFLLSNDAVNGNLIVESKNFKHFYDSVIPGDPLASYWDYPLEASMELKINKTQADLSNIILKYGRSTGAGSITLPLKSKSYIIGEDDDETKEVTAKFDMTDLDLTPIVAYLKDFTSRQLQEGATYSPEIPFDLKLNFSALKGAYRDQLVKNLALGLSLKKDVWSLESIDGIFPGNTQFKATGKLFSVEDILSYTASVDLQTESLKKLFEWLEIPLKTVVSSTYQKSSFNAAIVGDAKAIQVAPFTLAVDNTVLTGNFGVKRGKTPHYALEASTDSIILDNYLPKIFTDDSAPIDVLKDIWNKMQWANDVDMDLDLRAGLLIYEKTSFDKVVLKGSLNKGVLNVERFLIGDFLKSNLDMSGEISGFGDRLQFSNLNYDVSIADYLPLLQKLKIEQPKYNLKFFQPFSSKGVASMNADRLWLKAANVLGETKFSYNGRIESEKGCILNGELNLQSPNASLLLMNLPVSYISQDENLGRLKLKSQIEGNLDKFKLSNMLLSVGANIFQGAFGLDMTRGLPYWTANLKINRFESERFMPKGDLTPRFSVDKVATRTANLWVKPNLSDVPFNFDKLKNVQFVGNLDIGEFFVDDILLKNLKMQVENKNNELSLSDVNAGYHEGSLTANVKLSYAAKPTLAGNISVTNQNVHDLRWSGEVYGVNSGVAEIVLDINTPAISMRDTLNNFSGVLSLNIDAPKIKGISLDPIIADIKQRKLSDGLKGVLQNNLQTGETSFSQFSGKINFQDGNWLIDRAWLKSDAATIDISGSGNLEAWNMDELFTVQLAEPKDVQPFSFTLAGSVSHPELEVDPSLIVKVYDDQQARAEAAKQARQKAYETNLKSKLGVQKALLEEQKAVFDDFVNNHYLPLKAKVSADKYQKALLPIEAKLEAQARAFSEADLLLQEKTIKEEYIQQLAKISGDAKELLQETNKQMQEIYMQDLKELIAQNYALIEEENADKEKEMAESLAQRDAYLLRLNNIETAYRFQDDEMYAKLLKAIDENLQAYDAFLRDVKKENHSLDLETDISILEHISAFNIDTLANIKRQREILTDNINRYLNYLNEKIKVEEKAFNDRKEAQIKPKEVEKNIATITSSATGKSQTIITVVEPKAEESVPTTQDLGEVDVDDLEVNLLRETPSGVSGVILKK